MNAGETGKDTTAPHLSTYKQSHYYFYFWGGLKDKTAS